MEGRKVNMSDEKIDRFACEAIFSTLTNVNFDQDRFVDWINQTVKLRDELKGKVNAAGGKTDFPDGPADFTPAGTVEGLVEQGEKVGVK